MSHIYLYGPPGSGKSTIGKILAERLNLNFVDIDSVIVQNAGCEISEIFAKHGEQHFRDLESEAIEQSTSLPASVIALGGGALLRDRNREYAEKHGRVLCFTADSDTLLRRVRQAPGQRPLADEDNSIPEAESPLLKLLAKRSEHYRSFELTLAISDIPPETTADNVQCVLGRYRVSGMRQAYQVYVGEDLLQRSGELFTEHNLGGRCVIVADENTAPLYAETVAKSIAEAGLTVSTAVIPAGEAGKTIESVELLWRKFLQAGIERGDCVAALGGGVTGDLTGFAAATWLRGVRWVSLPTTLLAMCDSGVGGKTGTDLPEGKNLVGAFHAPALVISDIGTLRTLPVRELRCGLAETIKHGIINDTTLLEMLKHFSFCCCTSGEQPCNEHLRDQGWLAEFVARSMAVKIKIIEDDPFEGGRRAALNLGHTIGHGVEKATDFAIQHGEAVAIGTVAEARIAQAMNLAQPGVAKQLAGYFATVGLPVRPPEGINMDKVIKAIELDKKRSKGRVLFALPSAIGQVLTGIAVPDEILATTLRD
jgi:shikimate kinase / 3-dehydroquinate synthase